MSSRLKSINDWLDLAKFAGYRANALATTCHISCRQLERFFNGTMGCSPHTWLRDVRMRRAVELICDGNSIKEVAMELCYESSAHFTRDFKEYFGVTPSHYYPDSERPSLDSEMSQIVK